jgi:signal transduction histidine kinase
MLDGAEKDWQAAKGNLQAVYNLLPAGNYTFLVKAQNEEGVFSKNTTQIHFIIHPPFWQATWFITLEVLVCAIVIYYLYRMRINRLLHVERVRSRLARDLHDDMGSTLSTINILSNMAMKKLEKDTAATREYITRISNNSSRIMEAMDDIVWSINPLNDTMPRVIARMKEFAGSVLESKDIEYAFEIEEYVKDVGFDMESKRELYLIFKETINNLVKYSGCTKVTITMNHKKKIFILKVIDNGVGFNTQDPELQSTQRGNGLRNMQSRAEHINGRLTITSAPGCGTTVEVMIPIA